MNLDRSMHDPARRGDAIGDLFSALGAAAQEMANRRREAREALRAARRADPVIRANRSHGARKGWETRRANEENDRILAAIDDRPVHAGPFCDEMNHNSIGSEVFCRLEPRHEEDHDDDDGTTWEQGY